MMMTHPFKLAGLKQATYISQCLAKGQDRAEVILSFGGDEQLVDMWISFLKHNHWVVEGTDGRWSVTPKGKIWNSRTKDHAADSSASD